MSSTQLHSGKYPSYFEILPIPGANRLSTWLALGAVTAATALLCYQRWRLPALIGTFAILGVCIGVVPVVMKCIVAILLGWVQHAPHFLLSSPSGQCDWNSWFKQEFNNFNASKVTCYIGVAAGLLAVLSFGLGGAFQGLPTLLTLVCALITAVAGFTAGIGLSAIAYLARFVWQVGQKYNISRISEHEYGVLSTGSMLVKSYALVALVWCLYTSTATWTFQRRWVPLLALSLPAVSFIASSFVISQFPLHRRMVACKRNRLLELDNLLERLGPQEPSDMTEERRMQVEFCVAEIKRVRGLPEWPFSIGNLTGMVAACMTATAPQIMDAILPLIVKRASQ